MRKILLFGVLLLLVIGLAACGNSVENTADNSPPEATEIVQSNEDTEYPAEEALPDAQPAVDDEPDDYEPYEPTEPEPYEASEPEDEPVVANVVTEPAPEPAVYHDAELGFFVNGNFLGMSQLHAMEVAEFTVIIRPGTDREDIRVYRGVAIADILAHFGINSGSSLIFHSYDGFASGITMAEALDREQAFIAIWQDGQYFSQRGDYWAIAPFQLVMAQDIFAQRFARYITEIEVQ